jgi:hypothetical protein
MRLSFFEVGDEIRELSTTGFLWIKKKNFIPHAAHTRLAKLIEKCQFALRVLWLISETRVETLIVVCAFLGENLFTRRNIWAENFRFIISVERDRGALNKSAQKV